jgi:hypothetical protein
MLVTLGRLHRNITIKEVDSGSPFRLLVWTFPIFHIYYSGLKYVPQNSHFPQF